MSPVTPPVPAADTDDRTQRLPGGPSPVARPDAADDWAGVLRPGGRPGELGRLGPYRVLGVLGRGGMGVVFLADDPALKRRIALKTLIPGAGRDAAVRFLREARAAAAVEHDHVVTVHQVGEDAGVPFLAMPLLQGKTLATDLAAGPLAPAEVLRVGAEIAEGLAAAHARGLVHRDIKPGNVWLEGDRRRVKILDFGLVRATGVRPGSQSEFSLPAVGGGLDPITEFGETVGTPAYMSPEQALGEPVDHRTDLWSLGAVLYHAATGQMPFTGADSLAVLAAVTQTRPAPPVAKNPALPAGLNALIVRLMSRDPAGRPATAAAVAAELRALAAPPRRRWLTRRRVLAGLGVGLPLAAVAAVFVLPYLDPRHWSPDPGGRLTDLVMASGGTVQLADGLILRPGDRPPRPPHRPVAVTVGPVPPGPWRDLFDSLVRTESLRWVEFAGSPLTDADLAVLAHAPVGRKLEALSVRECPGVTEAALRPLGEMHGLKQLRLGVRVSPAAVRELAGHLPGCRIEWPGGVDGPAE